MAKRKEWISLIGIVVVALGALLANLIAGNHPALGLDLQGGASVTLQPVGSYESAAIDVAKEIITQRVDSLGIAEPEIIRQGDTIVVNLPGVRDQEQALALVGRTGKVLVRPVLSIQVNTTIDTSTTVPGDTTATTVAADSTVDAETTVPSETSAVPAESTAPSSIPTAEEEQAQTVQRPNPEGTLLYTLGPTDVTGEVFNNDAQAILQNGEWIVTVGLRDGAEGEDLWNALAAQCYNGTPTCPPQPGTQNSHGQMAIELDGVVISAPEVNAPSFDGEVSITGSFKESEARELAKILKFGAVPVQMEPQSVETVSATLGKDSLHAAIIAGLLGLVLVVIFMIFYYRAFAWLIVAGLVLSAAIQWSVISILSKTQGLALTLAGIAGIIVSIGITVDSFVVLFERVKDELHHGRSLRVSTTRGFAAGWRTTLAANLVSLLGAAVLWYLTVGSVRGFAFFLGLSTLCDLVILWFFTRPAVLLFGRSKKHGHRLFGVDVAQTAPAQKVPA